MNCRSMWIIKKLNASCDYGQPWSCLIEYQSSFSIKKEIYFFFFFWLIGLLFFYWRKKKKEGKKVKGFLFVFFLFFLSFCFYFGVALKVCQSYLKESWIKKKIYFFFYPVNVLKACSGSLDTMESSAFPSFSFLLILKYHSLILYLELGSEEWNLYYSSLRDQTF